ncbi:MAG TPA: POTRA domain-containing protein [Candidatus Acidoferrum sp.]|nr:POTRA domain-containing protein [Candidatus Acidoferrum sp.]
MLRSRQLCLGVSLLASLLPFLPIRAQSPAPATAILHEIRTEGLKTLSDSQILALSQLEKGSQVGKSDLTAAADRLLQTGMFANVNYTFQTRNEELTLTFQLEEAKRVPIYYDNIPWFSDGELGDAIRKSVPFFDGTLPEAGAVVDQAAEAVKQLLASHQLNVTLAHELASNPLGDGNVQEFHVEGATLHIASVSFGDPSLASSHTVQQQLAEVQGKPYSRTTIDLFLSEQLRPIYLQQGYLRVKLGPAEVRLTENPNQKLPEQIPVFIPIATGAVYRWKAAEWTGNSVLSSITLSNELGLKQGDVANGMQIEAGWDRAREEYGHIGYLDAKLDPVASLDDQAHTVAYTVSVVEGVQYRFNTMVLTGLSLAAERRLTQMWPTAAGAVFDKTLFENFLTNLESHPSEIFGDLPLHYDSVGHWLRTDAEKHLVDVLLDFK